MAITYPFDLLASFPGWSVEFELFHRQEQSRQANGRTIVKDMGSPLWRATYQSRSLKPNELDYWRARLDAMENGLKTFFGRSTSRCYPIDDPGGAKLAEGNDLVFMLDFANDYAVANDGGGLRIGAGGSDRKTVYLSGELPDGYTLRPGDLIQFGSRNLHRIVEATSPIPGFATTTLEVRPHLWPETAVGNDVSIVRPHCIMAIVPGSISTTADVSTGRGAVSFQAIEAR